MFRQKVSDVTNCTCRLISNDKNDFSIFRTTVHEKKSIHKDHKEKYSLKTQTIFSEKTDPKIVSVKKTISKVSKLSEDDRISITGNIDSKKKKLDRYKIFSPEGNVPKNFDEVKSLSGSLSKPESNFSKVAYVFRTRDQNKIQDQAKKKIGDFEGKTFGALQKFTIAHQNARNILNSISSSDKNKENTFKAGNIGHNQKMNEISGKSLKKIREIFSNQQQIRQTSVNATDQILNGSLQKYNKIREDSKRCKDIAVCQQKRPTEIENKNLFGNSNNSKIANPTITDKKKDYFETVLDKSLATQRKFPRGQYSQSKQFKTFLNNMRSNSLEKLPNELPLTSRASSINGKVQNQKKMHTFNDLMGDKKLSESILSDGYESQNDNSIVVMTFKDLIEKNKEQKYEIQEDINKLSFIKHTNENEIHKVSVMTSESDFLTKLKSNGSSIKVIPSGLH